MKCRIGDNCLDRSIPVASEPDYKDRHEQLAPFSTVLTTPKVLIHPSKCPLSISQTIRWVKADHTPYLVHS